MHIIHTHPLAQKWVLPTLSRGVMSRCKHQHGAIIQACCTAPNSLNTRGSWKCYHGFLQTQRSPWNSSKPWCFYQWGKGIHLTSWKDRTFSCTQQPWKRQFHSPLCSTREERGFCPDPARNESKGWSKLRFSAHNWFFLYKRIMHFGQIEQNHGKANSIVNCRNRDSTEIFSKQNAKTGVVYCNIARDAATAYSSIKGSILMKILQK